MPRDRQRELKRITSRTPKNREGVKMKIDPKELPRQEFHHMLIGVELKLIRRAGTFMAPDTILMKNIRDFGIGDCSSWLGSFLLA